eukprot:5701599-Heterocapsa_arctica.AAC.1
MVIARTSGFQFRLEFSHARLQFQKPGFEMSNLDLITISVFDTDLNPWTGLAGGARGAGER